MDADFNTLLSFSKQTMLFSDHRLDWWSLLYLISLSSYSDCTNKKKKKKEKGIDRLSLAFELHEGAYCSSFREKTVEEWREKGKRRRHIILRGIKYKETWENENFNEHHVYHE